MTRHERREWFEALIHMRDRSRVMDATPQAFPADRFICVGPPDRRPLTFDEIALVEWHKPYVTTEEVAK